MKFFQFKKYLCKKIQLEKLFGGLIDGRIKVIKAYCRVKSKSLLVSVYIIVNLNDWMPGNNTEYVGTVSNWRIGHVFQL